MAAKTGDGLVAIEQVQLHRPQLILLDIHLPGLNGLQAMRAIKAQFPDTQIVVFAAIEEEQLIWEAICYGASGILIKGVDARKMLSTIQDCLEGRISFPSSIQSRLLQALHLSLQAERLSALKTESVACSTPRGDKRLTSLTPREQNVINHLKQGKSNHAIASELFLTAGTVKNYLYAIYRKLNVSSRTEAIAFLHQHD